MQGRQGPRSIPGRPGWGSAEPASLPPDSLGEGVGGGMQVDRHVGQMRNSEDALAHVRHMPRQPQQEMVQEQGPDVQGADRALNQATSHVATRRSVIPSLQVGRSSSPGHGEGMGISPAAAPHQLRSCTDLQYVGAAADSGSPEALQPHAGLDRSGVHDASAPAGSWNTWSRASRWERKGAFFRIPAEHPPPPGGAQVSAAAPDPAPRRLSGADPPADMSCPGTMGGSPSRKCQRWQSLPLQASWAATRRGEGQEMSQGSQEPAQSEPGFSAAGRPGSGTSSPVRRRIQEAERLAPLAHPAKSSFFTRLACSQPPAARSPSGSPVLGPSSPIQRERPGTCGSIEPQVPGVGLHGAGEQSGYLSQGTAVGGKGAEGMRGIQGGETWEDGAEARHGLHGPLVRKEWDVLAHDEHAHRLKGEPGKGRVPKAAAGQRGIYQPHQGSRVDMVNAPGSRDLRASNSLAEKLGRAMLAVEGAHVPAEEPAAGARSKGGAASSGSDPFVAEGMAPQKRGPSEDWQRRKRACLIDPAAACNASLVPDARALPEHKHLAHSSRTQLHTEHAAALPGLAGFTSAGPHKPDVGPAPAGVPQGPSPNAVLFNVSRWVEASRQNDDPTYSQPEMAELEMRTSFCPFTAAPKQRVAPYRGAFDANEGGELQAQVPEHEFQAPLLPASSSGPPHAALPSMSPDESGGKHAAKPEFGLFQPLSTICSPQTSASFSGVTHGLVHARALVPMLDVAESGDEKNAAKGCIEANAIGAKNPPSLE